jgi:hypothetical protein
MYPGIENRKRRKKENRKMKTTKEKNNGVVQGCQIFLGTTYIPNRGENIPNDHKMATKFAK